jgi:hypothetical protein
MKLNDSQIEQALHQFEAEAIPAEHPVIAQLERLYGEHTYFLDGNGLSIVEPLEPDVFDGRRGVVVNLANWANTSNSSLQPHDPEATEFLVDLEPRRH